VDILKFEVEINTGSDWGELLDLSKEVGYPPHGFPSESFEVKIQ
jgi:hypothetical protein